jgi:hypothetical protein
MNTACRPVPAQPHKQPKGQCESQSIPPCRLSVCLFVCLSVCLFVCLLLGFCVALGATPFRRPFIRKIVAAIGRSRLASGVYLVVRVHSPAAVHSRYCDCHGSAVRARLGWSLQLIITHTLATTTACHRDTTRSHYRAVVGCTREKPNTACTAIVLSHRLIQLHEHLEKMRYKPANKHKHARSLARRPQSCCVAVLLAVRDTHAPRSRA